MSINQYMDISTGHLTNKTVNGWAVRNPFPVVAYYNCGIIVHVPNETPDGIPSDLKAAIDYARTQGCQMIRFDSDGDRVDDLAWHDW